MRFLLRFLPGLLALALLARADDPLPSRDSAPSPSDTASATEPEAHPISTTLELQVELHRRGFSCGAIDGVMGAQTVAALKSYQRAIGLPESGTLDETTRTALPLTAPAVTTHEFTKAELDQILPVPPTWLAKSELPALAYGTPLESAAEHHRANPKLLQQLNPDTDWDNIVVGTRIQVPAVDRVVLPKTAARILIGLEARELEIMDDAGNILAHFPVSIARMAEKRPVGELHVKVVIPDPNYTFDPAVFPESAEAKELNRKLILPPGPNNPVGVAWIGLDRTGYGIHGTPDPEKVGRTESHGCFRLANWDALTLLSLARVGLPVIVMP